MIGGRIRKLEQFFNVRRPRELNELEWIERLHEMEQEWEEEHGEEFPL